MQSLQYMCGRVICKQVIAGNIVLDENIPKPLIRFIQTLNPYLTDSNYNVKCAKQYEECYDNILRNQNNLKYIPDCIRIV